MALSLSSIPLGEDKSSNTLRYAPRVEHRPTTTPHRVPGPTLWVPDPLGRRPLRALRRRAVCRGGGDLGAPPLLGARVHPLVRLALQGPSPGPDRSGTRQGALGATPALILARDLRRRCLDLGPLRRLSGAFTTRP